MITSLDIEWAWFAGLFEGEGHIGLVGANSVSLRINMTDRDVLERVCALVGGSIVTLAKVNEQKQRWCWQVVREDRVRVALERMKPYLMSRRLARLEEAERRLAQVRRHGYCHKGHRLDAVNLLISPTSRRCRICQREGERARRAR
jgi:hypothetical protein